MMKISVLDLLPLRQGQSLEEAYKQMVELAKWTESLGYHRFWIGEHHNSPAFASTATLQLMQYVLAGTETIRVGSGGVMLPNHSPLQVAEQVGTLSRLFPGRVDLGLGRAPGTDSKTAQALRLRERAVNLELEVEELQSYFRGDGSVLAFPAQGQETPFFILGSSADSASWAARLGLPYVFAAHFAPKALEEAVKIYRRDFQPSASLKESYLILALNLALADSQAEAESLATSQLQMFADIVTNQQAFLKEPMDKLDQVWESLTEGQGQPHFGPLVFETEGLVRQTRKAVETMFSMTLMGDGLAARESLQDIEERFAPDEILVADYIYDWSAKKRAYQILAELVNP